MEKLTTKQRILFAALELFSQRGYDGVGVDEIAAAVGIKGPSLYHHFRGKEAILDGIVAYFESYYQERFESHPDSVVYPPSCRELLEQSLRRIDFTIHDSQIRKLRRFLAMEQFRSIRLGKLATAHQLLGLTSLYSGIFAHMMGEGLFKKDAPELLALEFISPVSLLIARLDREPEAKEEILALIQTHMEHFIKIYGV